MNISDEAVEAAARALYKGQPIYDEVKGVITGHKPWEWMDPAYQDAMLADARGALEAAAPKMQGQATQPDSDAILSILEAAGVDKADQFDALVAVRKLMTTPHRSQGVSQQSDELRDFIQANMHRIDGFERWTFQAPVDLADALIAAGWIRNPHRSQS